MSTQLRAGLDVQAGQMWSAAHQLMIEIEKKVTETVISVWVWTSHNINEEPCGDGTV